MVSHEMSERRTYFKQRLILCKNNSIEKGNRVSLYYLLDYTIVYFLFLAKNDPASKKVGAAANPIIINQSFANIGTVWKIG